MKFSSIFFKMIEVQTLFFSLRKFHKCILFFSSVDNFLKARIRPDAVTSNDVLNLAFNPRKAICEGDFASKIIVSENFTQPNIEVCKLEKKLSGKIFYSPIICRSTAKETRLVHEHE